MAISKKYSRRITVDGVVYRWKIDHRPGASEFDYAGPMVAAVQLADHSGQVLLIRCGLRHGNILDQPGAQVTPRRIAEAIRAALAAGWKPAERGPAFRIDMPVAE